MSEYNLVNSTSNQAHITYNTEKLFRFDNRFITAEYTNSTGGDVTLEPGRLMGRVSATEKVLPLVSSAVDGSQLPLGILNVDGDTVVADTETLKVSICVSGTVNENLVKLDAGDDFNTVVDGKTIRDRIGSDTVGVYLKVYTELTGYDNS